jgi:VIT1/CCC1 family predicted Fe2+/Mn2+ transporter
MQTDEIKQKILAHLKEKCPPKIDSAPYSELTGPKIKEAIIGTNPSKKDLKNFNKAKKELSDDEEIRWHIREVGFWTTTTTEVNLGKKSISHKILLVSYIMGAIILFAFFVLSIGHPNFLIVPFVMGGFLLFFISIF